MNISHRLEQSGTEMNIFGFDNGSFDSTEYISEYIANIKLGEETKQLSKLKRMLTAKSNTNSEHIKNIVFDHYKQFIEASRNVSGLESGIYQLSMSLNEQKAVINNLMEMCGREKSDNNSSSSTTITALQQKESHFLMYKIEGIATVINGLKEDERIILHSKMVLLDSDTFEPKNPIYMVLLSSSLIISHPSNPGSKYPFSFESTHSLNDIALVNVKGSGRANVNRNSENILQLLIFPNQIFIKCENGRIKRDWLDCIEEAKRKRQEVGALARQATIRARRQSILSSFVSKSAFKNVPEKGKKMEQQATDVEEKPEDLQWLRELITELHDVISHRHMDQAVEMLLEWKSCRCVDPLINTEFENIERNVIQILTDEIKRPGPLHGKRVTVPIQQLISLNRGIYAVDLYLKRRSNALRSSVKEFQINEPLFYVRKLSSLIVNDIIEVQKEFDGQPEYYALILHWASKELSILITLIRRRIIEASPTMTVLAHTWRILMGKCQLLTAIGIDLTFEVNSLVAPSLKIALENNFNNILQSLRLRISDEKWRLTNLENEQNLHRFLEEISDLGLSLDWAISKNPNRKWCLEISQNVCNFAKIIVVLSRDLEVITAPCLQPVLDNHLNAIWLEFLEFLDKSKNSSEVFQNSLKFTVSQIVPLCDRSYKEEMISALVTKKFPNFVVYMNNSFNKGEEDSEEVASV